MGAFKELAVACLILGLIIFLGVHSVRTVADGWRTRTLAQVGEGRYKGIYTLLSLLGFALIIWGFWLARQRPPPCGRRRQACAIWRHC